MAWVPGSRSKFGNWTTVPSLYSWNIAECDVKPQTTNHPVMQHPGKFKLFIRTVNTVHFHSCHRKKLRAWNYFYPESAVQVLEPVFQSPSSSWSFTLSGNPADWGQRKVSHQDEGVIKNIWYAKGNLFCVKMAFSCKNRRRCAQKCIWRTLWHSNRDILRNVT